MDIVNQWPLDENGIYEQYLNLPNRNTYVTDTNVCLRDNDTTYVNDDGTSCSEGWINHQNVNKYVLCSPSQNFCVQDQLLNTNNTGQQVQPINLHLLTDHLEQKFVNGVDVINSKKYNPVDLLISPVDNHNVSVSDSINCDYSPHYYWNNCATNHQQPSILHEENVYVQHMNTPSEHQQHLPPVTPLQTPIQQLNPLTIRPATPQSENIPLCHNAMQQSPAYTNCNYNDSVQSSSSSVPQVNLSPYYFLQSFPPHPDNEVLFKSSETPIANTIHSEYETLSSEGSIATSSPPQNSNKNVGQRQRKKGEANKRLYPCNTCGKVFNRSYNQQQHVLIVHAAVRKKLYGCSYENCNKSYYRSADLQRHKRTHLRTNTKFSCPNCSKCFYRSNQLQKHFPCNKTPTQNSTIYLSKDTNSDLEPKKQPIPDSTENETQNDKDPDYSEKLNHYLHSDNGKVSEQQPNLYLPKKFILQAPPPSSTATHQNTMPLSQQYLQSPISSNNTVLIVDKR